MYLYTGPGPRARSRQPCQRVNRNSRIIYRKIIAIPKTVLVVIKLNSLAAAALVNNQFVILFAQNEYYILFKSRRKSQWNQLPGMTIIIGIYNHNNSSSLFT